MNIEFSVNYFNNHLIKLTTIVENKLNICSFEMTLSYVLRLLKKTSEIVFFEMFISEFGDLDTMVENDEELFELYFNTTLGNSLSIKNLGLFSFYFMSLSNGVYNYIDTNLYLFKKIESVKERYELNIYEKRLNNVSKIQIISMDDIDLMTGIEFEHLVSSFFKEMGYKSEVTKGSGDQGIDVIAEKNGSKIGIQVKNYSGNVSNSAIQEVVAGISHYKLNKARVVTNSYFTKSAIELANSNDVILWDRDVLGIKIKENEIRV